MSPRNYKPQPRLPAEPLREYLLSRIPLIAADTAALYEVAENTVRRRYGIDVRTWRHIFERDYVFMKYADDICGRLGKHPCELWGDEWFTA